MPVMIPVPYCRHNFLPPAQLFLRRANLTLRRRSDRRIAVSLAVPAVHRYVPGMSKPCYFREVLRIFSPFSYSD